MFLAYPASPASTAPSPIHRHARSPRLKHCGGDEKRTRAPHPRSHEWQNLATSIIMRRALPRNGSVTKT